MIIYTNFFLLSWGFLASRISGFELPLLITPDKKLVKAAQSLGANGRQLWLHVLIPAALPMIITGLRISTAMSMMALVGVEMISSESGLGFLVIDAQRIFETDRMFAGIIMLSMIGFSLDRLARMAQNRLVSWHIETSLGGTGL